ncbi:hypothetical protein [Actinomadura sp. 21ATH]
MTRILAAVRRLLRRRTTTRTVRWDSPELRGTAGRAPRRIEREWL